MLSAFKRLDPESVDLADAAGRTLAGALAAARDQPPFAAAVMDGYALRAADAPGELRIAGESAAGHAFLRALGEREAVRISTGAPLPAGADAVLAQEDANLQDRVLKAAPIARGQYVRPRGGDFSAGDTLLEDARSLDAGAIALLAGAGRAQVRVTRRPRISILANGDELVAPGAAPRADQIFDSATYAVAALAARWGAVARRLDPLADSSAAIAARLAHAHADCDVLVMIGGASVGPHDHMRPAIRALGGEISVEGISVRPGRPTWFATMPSGGAVLGLPGNPASALVCARLFLAAAIETMLSGAQARSRASFQAALTRAMPANGAREAYVRGVNTDGRLDPILDEDSSLMSVLARSNCLVQRPVASPPAAIGETVRCLSWSPQD
jgi:molybdopterin molybdotransferase